MVAPLLIDGPCVHKSTDGTQQLQKANRYQKKSRNKMCCALLILIMVLAVIVVVVVMQEKNKPGGGGKNLTLAQFAGFSPV